MSKITKIIFLFSISAIFNPIKYFSASALNLGSCGKSTRARGAIIGGSSLSAAQRGSFPWVTALITRNNEYFCGGVLISNNAVLTAAHCIQPKGEKTQKLPRDVRSLLGVFDLKDPFEIGRFSSATEEIRVHPKWNPDTTRYDADIAVIIMDQDAPLNNYVRPICITKLDSSIFTTKNGQVVGYGLSSSYASKAETIPRLLRVPIHKNEECFLHNKELAGISSLKTFCAGSGTGSGVCLGDSGSGLYVESNGVQYLRGIVSASLITLERTCDVDDYAIYTSVSDYYDWIVGNDLIPDPTGGVCNGCIFNGIASTGICNACSLIGNGRIGTCNGCKLSGRNGSASMNVCNGCSIEEVAGPVWIKYCKGCKISNCDGCIKNVEFVGVNVHIIDKCYGCDLRECHGCLISKDENSS